MRTGTVAAAVVGAIVAVALIIKEQLTGPAPSPAPAGTKPAAPAKPKPAAPKTKPAAPKARKAPAAPAKSKSAATTSKVVEDLSEINGIGPVYKTKLAEAGIATFAQLGRADASEIAKKIDAPVSRVQAWIDAARRRSA